MRRPRRGPAPRRWLCSGSTKRCARWATRSSPRPASVDQPRSGRSGRVIGVEVDADCAPARDAGGVTDDLTGQWRAVATVDGPVGARRVDGAYELSGRTPVHCVGTGVGGGRIEHDTVVLLSGVHVRGALRVLVQARAGREVELHGSGRDLCGGAWRGDLPWVGRDHAVVLVCHVATAIGRILKRHRRVLLRQQAGWWRAVAEALRSQFVIGRTAVYCAGLCEAQG